MFSGVSNFVTTEVHITLYFGPLDIQQVVAVFCFKIIAVTEPVHVPSFSAAHLNLNPYDASGGDATFYQNRTT